MRRNPGQTTLACGSLRAPRRLLAALFALIAFGCGGGSDAPQPASEPSSAAEETREPGANRPPLVEAIDVLPSQPRSGEPIQLSVKALDPDGDDLQVVVDWYRNGQLQEEAGSETLETTGFLRGDQINAVVRVSDGSEEVSQTTSYAVIANSRPRVTRVELFPPAPTATDTLIVEAQATDIDGDGYELRYRWRVNGTLLEDATTNSLAPNRVKRGDTLQLAVAAADAEGEGEWFEAMPLQLANGVPKITSAPGRTLASATRYEYAIQASDPDGDKPLRYRLVKGPSGMQVDLVSGVVSWEVPETADGKFDIEVAVSDAYGGESSQAYTLEFQWSGTPAAPADAETRPEPARPDEPASDDESDESEQDDEPEAEAEPESEPEPADEP
jgi:hypothetical protein